MTDANLDKQTLGRLKTCRSVALDNLWFYNCLYDDMGACTDRERIGRAMAQKQSFIGAVDAILANHGIDLKKPETDPANDCRDMPQQISPGDHLEQETGFHHALQDCLSCVNDTLTEDLLNHHLKAAELAMTAIKSTSLKI